MLGGVFPVEAIGYIYIAWCVSGIMDRPAPWQGPAHGIRVN